MRVENTAFGILHSFENFKKIWQLERVCRSDTSAHERMNFEKFDLNKAWVAKPEGMGLPRTESSAPGTYFQEQGWFKQCLFRLLIQLPAWFIFILWRKRKHKANQNPFIKLWTKTNSLLEQLWGFWRSPGPEVVKPTTAKTGINAENCYTLSWTGSWSRWSLWFDNIQRLSQLILSERKQR